VNPARFQLDANWAHTLVAVDGRLITIVGGNDAVNESGRMIVIDPADSAVSRIQMPSRYHSTTQVMSRGQVWVSLEPGFIRFDPPAEGFPEPSLTLPSKHTDCCGFIEGDDRGIWFLSLRPESGTQLDVFDPTTGDVTELVTRRGQPGRDGRRA